MAALVVLLRGCFLFSNPTSALVAGVFALLQNCTGSCSCATSRSRGCGALGSDSFDVVGPLAAGERRWQDQMVGRTGTLVVGCVLETLVRHVYGVTLDAGVDMTCMQRDCVT